MIHPAGARHDTGTLHPERPARLRAANAGVAASGVRVQVEEAVPVEPSDLHIVHDPEYVDAIRRFCAAGGGELDSDTVASPQSWPAALAAAGAGSTAVRHLSNGFDGPAFVSVRPPGHHALSNRAMGFCLFNNVAVTAARLRDEGRRVAIVDWDVHHGNGTQAMFYDDPAVLYASIHQSPFYPYQGATAEVGSGAGRGTTINVPLPAFTAGDVYRAAFDGVVMPVLRRFLPDWILVSAGYDAHAADPLAEFRLVEDDYGAMAASLREVVAPSRIVAFLEGGYHLPAIRDSVTATMRALCGAGTEPDESPFTSPDASRHALERAMEDLDEFISG